MSKKVFSSGGTGGYHLGGAGKSISKVAKPEDAVPHNGVPASKLKQHCLKEGVLFEDPDFPAVDASLFFSKKPPRPFVWKRPQEIVADPRMFVGGASRFDITQGMLGDCWLLAAVAALCQYEGLLFQVVPKSQPLSSKDKDYCGLVTFRFWQYGRWEEVVVDDRLPTYNNRLVFLHSAQNNEFWSALLEKAYAKLCGSYEALKGGQTSEAMEDFTGGVTETFNMAKAPPNFFKLLTKAQDRQSLMCCSIEAKPNEIEAKLDNGLIKGHAYTITAVSKVKANTRKGPVEVELIRIRNPWGNEREWTGAWSDESDEWKMLSEEEKSNIGLNYDDDGEFWMSFADFSKNYTRVEVCMLSPDSAGESDRKRWEMQINQGSWQSHVSAGGCRNFPDTFYLNPQYIVKLEDPDDDDEVDNCTIVLGLIQKGRRKQKRVGAQNLTIGFSIYKLEDDVDQYMDNDRLSKDYFLYHKSFARSENFVNAREVTGRFSLPPGEYAILPSTFKNNEEGDFIFRMFSEKAHGSSSIENQHSEARTRYERRHHAENIHSERHSSGKTRRSDSASKYRSVSNEVTGRSSGTKVHHSVQKSITREHSSNEVKSSKVRTGHHHATASKHVHRSHKNKKSCMDTQTQIEYKPKKVSATDNAKFDEKFKGFFEKVAGSDGEIDAFELQRILNQAFKAEIEGKELSLEACRSMVAMVDVDRSGRLEYPEFRELWTTIMEWKNNFKTYDKDNSGDMNAVELRGALAKLGFKLSTPVLSSLTLRYANRKGNINFDDFLQICCRIKSTFESYLGYQGKSFSLDDYIMSAVYT